LRIIKDILVCFNSVFTTDESRKATKDLLKIVNTKEAYDLNNPFKGINEILSNYDLVKLNRTNLNGTGDID
jgi:ABC-type transporter Mla subunit MlaD